MGCLSHVPTGDPAHNPHMCPDQESKQWPFSLQVGIQSTEAQEPGLNFTIYIAKYECVQKATWMVQEEMATLWCWADHSVTSIPCSRYDNLGKSEFILLLMKLRFEAQSHQLKVTELWFKSRYLHHWTFPVLNSITRTGVLLSPQLHTGRKSNSKCLQILII